MNIAILIPELGTGGAERAASVIGNYYSQRGHNVFYFLFVRTDRVFYRVEGKVVNTRIFSPFASSNLFETLIEMFFTSRRLRELENKYHIDVSLSFMEEWNFINGFAKSGVRRIASVRTVLSERKEFSGILYQRKWVTRMLSRVDKVVAVSDYVNHDLQNNYGIFEKKLVTIPNVSVKREVITEEPWIYGNKVVVSVGRLDQIKQHENIIRAFSRTASECDDAELCIVGDGKLMGQLRELVQKLGLVEKVHLVGAQKDVSFYVSNARVFVMASKVEGFPNAMVEAMAFGVPIITTDTPGGCGEIVGKEESSDDIQYSKYGILTPYIGDEITDDSLTSAEEKLSQAMVRLLEDDELYTKYKKASYERSQMYSYEAIMPLWDKELGIE